MLGSDSVQMVFSAGFYSKKQEEKNTYITPNRTMRAEGGWNLSLSVAAAVHQIQAKTILMSYCYISHTALWAFILGFIQPVKKYISS